MVDTEEKLHACLADLRLRLPDLRNRTQRLTEEDTKRILITPLLASLGWDVNSPDEMMNQYRHGSHGDPVDYALFLGGRPTLFIEAKALWQSLDDPRWRNQSLKYAYLAGVDWCVLTNGDAYRIYRVHAEGDAEHKLFQETSISKNSRIEEVSAALVLLERERLRSGVINAIWHQQRMDRLVDAAFREALDDDKFAKLIKDRIGGGVQIGQVRESLKRASIRIEFPAVRDSQHKAEALVSTPPPPPRRPVTPSPAAARAHKPTQPVRQAAADDSEESSTQGREYFQRTPELFSLGRLKAGDVLTIRNRAGSAATVIDGRYVEYRGERLSYLAWGKKVTGWKAIQIYKEAMTSDGRLLDSLRDAPQVTKAAKASD